MGRTQIDLELDIYLQEVISSRKVSLKDTKQIALNLWSIICSNQKEHSSNRVVIHHYHDGRIVTTLYSEKVLNTTNSSRQIHSFVDDKLVDYWADPELLTMISIIAGNSDVKGKCRLSDNGICKELHLEFK